MTLQEVSELHIGDKLQLINGAEAVVLTINSNALIVGLSMTGGSTSDVPGELPPEKTDQPTRVICAWVDLATATKVVEGARVFDPKVAERSTRFGAHHDWLRLETQ